MASLISAAALAKAKATTLLLGSLAAGGVGGAVALSHVAPTSHLVRDAAATTPDDGSVDATSIDTGTVDAGTVDAGTVEAVAPDQATDEAGGDYALPDCPADVKNHGAYVSSVARGAPKGKGADHGSWVSQAAKSDCGMPAGADSGDSAADEPDADTDADQGGKPDAPGSNGRGHDKAETSESTTPGAHGKGQSADKAGHSSH